MNWFNQIIESNYEYQNIYNIFDKILFGQHYQTIKTARASLPIPTYLNVIENIDNGARIKDIKDKYNISLGLIHDIKRNKDKFLYKIHSKIYSLYKQNVPIEEISAQTLVPMPVIKKIIKNSPDFLEQNQQYQKTKKPVDKKETFFQQVMNYINVRKEQNQKTNLNDIATYFNITPYYIQKLFKDNNVELNEVASSRISDELKKRIVEIQKEAIKEFNQPISVNKINQKLIEEGFPTNKNGFAASFNVIYKVLAEYGLPTKSSKRDPDLRYLLILFYETQKKSFWKTLESVDDTKKFEIISNLIDRVFEDPKFPELKNPNYKKMLKEYFFSKKIQLRDIAYKGLNTNKKQLKEIPKIIQKNIIDMHNNKNNAQQISKALNIPIENINNVINNYDWKNFKYDPTHPSTYLTKHPQSFNNDVPSNIEAKNMKIIKTSKWIEQIEGGRAEGKSPKDFDPKQIEKGIKIEYEHTDDKNVATEIAMDHLTEDPKYYDYLEDMEKKFKK